MQENFELVQKGFRILVSSMSGYIGQELNKIYKNVWWNEVLSTLYDQRDLPSSGTYGELLDSLDIANCIRLLDRKWNDVFRNLLPQDCRTWSKELMGVRNIVAHIGQQDLEQPVAERSLDTMALLCKEIDSEGAEEIREIYRDVRARAAGVPSTAGYVGLSQPASDSKRGELTEGSLLQLVGTEAVQKTMPDQRKFIRDIKGLIKNGTYDSYFEEQQKWASVIKEKFEMTGIHSKDDIDKFAEENKVIAEELQLSMQKALIRSRSQLLKNKPAENISKSIALLTEVDARLFAKMDMEEKENLKAELDEVTRIVKNFKRMLSR